MITENNFKEELDKLSAIILANIKFDEEEIENNNDEYVLIENPIQRINEIKY